GSLEEGCYTPLPIHLYALFCAPFPRAKPSPWGRSVKPLKQRSHRRLKLAPVHRRKVAWQADLQPPVRGGALRAALWTLDLKADARLARRSGRGGAARLCRSSFA